MRRSYRVRLESESKVADEALLLDRLGALTGATNVRVEDGSSATQLVGVVDGDLEGGAAGVVDAFADRPDAVVEYHDCRHDEGGAPCSPWAGIEELP